MNDTLQAIMLGLAQGITEFLPISSSGHTFLLGHFFGMEASVLLIAVLHLGSLIAVCLYFYAEIVAILRGIWRAVRERALNEDAELGLKLGVATFLTIPTALAVEYILPLEQISVGVVAWTLMLTGALILIAEYAPKHTRDFSWTLAILLGLVQGLAVVPGISRAGLTIAFLVLIGIARHRAAHISFLLAIPTILGAAVFAVHDAAAEPMQLTPLLLISAFIASIGASLLSIKYMLRLIQGRWVWFAPYCFLLAFWLILL